MLDLYLPQNIKAPVPDVIGTGGSAWMADNGKITVGWLVPALNRAGYAVAGVSIRSSAQAQFLGQLHDIKAAIRWLRKNGAQYGIDGAWIAIMGDSSGGWTSAIAATTGDVPELEGNVGVAGVLSAVQAAIAFFPPTYFTAMDKWALRPCKPGSMMQVGMQFCHNSSDSPESRLMDGISPSPRRAAISGRGAGLCSDSRRDMPFNAGARRYRRTPGRCSRSGSAPRQSRSDRHRHKGQAISIRPVR